MYVVIINRKKHGFHIRVGTNPWLRKRNNLHLGRILSNYGGGGHRNVGAADIKSGYSAHKAAREIAEKLK